ncbi:MAG: ABC transporter ATP-binding protein [Acidimicrobiales bacterium]|jgi:ABC-2 type transport system ATP-binding protein
MTYAISASGLGKRYGRKWALSNCSLDIPEGRVVGLVGPNGAGKTTLLHLAVGLLSPTVGSISVLGEGPASSAEQLGRIGFVAQDTPVYSGLSIDAHLQMGAALNSTWDAQVAKQRINDLGLDPGQRAGRLSGGQRAQLALTLAIAKRPALLLLDEPVASLDPLARREFLAILMEVVVEHNVSVILSSHLVADLERVCDYLVVLAASRVQVNGAVDDLLSTHHRITGTPKDLKNLPDTVQVIESSSTDRQTTATVRSVDPIMDPAWSIESVTMEDLVLAYMGQAEEQRRDLVRSKGGAK